MATMNKTYKSRKTFIFLILFSFVSIFHLWAADESQTSLKRAIEAFEKYVAEQMETQNIPGLSAGFMKNDFVWTKGFGYADLENMSPAKPESSYRLASITKTITAIAVLKLVEEGKLDLEAEVQTYVPYFPKKEWPVTIRQLLGHIGGISHYQNSAVESHIKVHKNTKQAVEIFKDFDLVAEPGTKYNYSSYGFNLLGAVIEGASGKSYGNVIKEYIFNPLGMENSRMDDPADLIPNRVRGYRMLNRKLKNSEYVDVSSRFAGGGTRSTIVDLLKYAKGIIEGKILEKQTWEKIFTSMALQNQHFTGYGMGWTVSPIRGHFVVRHGGSQPETRTFLVLLPKKKLAIALASNREGLNLTPFYQRLLELVLDEDIDSYAYTSDWPKITIYDWCIRIFSYGMGYFERYGKPLSQEKEEIAQSFSYFNTYVDDKAIKNNYKDTIEKIEDGIHPIAKQAFTNIGSFIAFTLEDEYGKDSIKKYYKKGPLAFFNDYISLSKKKSNLKDYRFKKNITTLLTKWKKDWNNTYTDFVKHLNITSSTDFDEIGPKLKNTFSGADFYPDFIPEISDIAWQFIDKNDIEKALEIISLNKELYPNSPVPLCTLGFVHIMTDNTDKARTLYNKAYELNPFNEAVSVSQFIRYGNRLAREKKIKEALALSNIALEIYPKEAQLYAVAGDRYSLLRQKENAIKFYKKALELDPELERVKQKLKILEKIGLEK